MIQYDIACSDKAFDVESCRKAAESGYPPAQYNLGFCYETGHDVSRDEEKAFSWYKNAAKQGDSFAMHALGRCYANSIGTIQDDNCAAFWFDKAVEQIIQTNDDIRQDESADFDQSNDDEIDWETAFDDNDDDDVLMDSKAGKTPESKWDTGVASNDEEAVRLCMTAAENGNPDAQYELGRCYENGRGISQSLADAAAWFAKAADKKHALAQYRLAQCYETGRGVTLDLMKATDLYWEMYDSDSKMRRTAVRKISEYYETGIYFRWLCETAESGNALAPAAMYELGFLYLRGFGAPRDFDKAILHFQKAAKADNTDALCRLGLCYEFGDGVKKDLEQAVSWYRKAAALGDAHATAALERLGI